MLTPLLAALLGAAPAAQPATQPADNFLTFERPPGTTAGVDAGWGRVVGPWHCVSSQRQDDGSFKETPGAADWRFYYALDGTAIQDVWRPAGGGAVGTNLRIHDPDTDRWQMVWTTASQHRFDHFEATVEDGSIVMTGAIPAGGGFPAHQARIVFHAITDAGFEWYYEAGGANAPESFQVFSRISCRRQAPG